MAPVEVTVVRSKAGDPGGYELVVKRARTARVIGQLTVTDIYALRDACIDGLDDIEAGRL